MWKGKAEPPRNEQEANHRIFLLLCAVLGFMSLVVLLTGGRSWFSNLIALALMWGLLFLTRYLAHVIPVVYHYFQDLHAVHRQVDQTQQEPEYQGTSLTPEEQAKFDSLAERWNQ